MSEEDEYTMLEYARFYGIALDHLEWNHLQELSIPCDISAQLEDPRDVFRISDTSGSLPLERLSVGTEAAGLLSSITNIGKRSRRFDEDAGFDVHRFQKIKQELPILLTDHELDLRNFAPQVVPDLENEHLPLEKLDEDADEGIGWPSIYQELPDKFFKDAEAERLALPKQGLLYLQEVLRNQSSGAEGLVFECNRLPHKRVCIDLCKVRKC